MEFLYFFKGVHPPATQITINDLPRSHFDLQVIEANSNRWQTTNARDMKIWSVSMKISISRIFCPLNDLEILWTFYPNNYAAQMVLNKRYPNIQLHSYFKSEHLFITKILNNQMPRSYFDLQVTEPILYRVPSTKSTDFQISIHLILLQVHFDIKIYILNISPSLRGFEDNFQSHTSSKYYKIKPSCPPKYNIYTK